MATKPPPKDDPDTAPPAGIFDSALAGSVKESAQQIWLAGMGAFAKAQAEGGKVFESLVKEGASLQRKTQQVAEEKIVEVQAKAGQQWGKLESLFEERTERALGRLGVPTGKDIESLAARIDALSAQVAQLAKATATKPSAKSASKSAAKNKAPAKKTALKKTTSSRPKTRRATLPSS